MVSFRKSLFINSALVLFFIFLLLAYFLPLASAQDEQIPVLKIPAIHVETNVASLELRTFEDGTISWDTTRISINVGHLEGTAYPGRKGNTVIGGHSELPDRSPAVFFDLAQLNRGDQIIIEHNDEILRYAVVDVFEVDDTDLSILYPTETEILTLITCDIDSYAANRYSRRVVVVAERTKEQIKKLVVSSG